jgi:hypothetical protein
MNWAQSMPSMGMAQSLNLTHLSKSDGSKRSPLQVKRIMDLYSAWAVRTHLQVHISGSACTATVLFSAPGVITQ